MAADSKSHALYEPCRPPPANAWSNVKLLCSAHLEPVKAIAEENAMRSLCSTLAAMGEGNVDGRYQTLRSSIPGYARMITEITQGPLHALSARQPPPSAADLSLQLNQTLSAR